MNIGGLILYKLLTNNKDQSSIEAFPKLRNNYFQTEYVSIFGMISNHYNKFSELPSFSELIISKGREDAVVKNIKALSKTEDLEVNMEVLTDALINEYAQNQTLDRMESLVDIITTLDTEEIKSELSDISLYLEENTSSSDSVCLMNNIFSQSESDTQKSFVPLNFNNTFDSDIRAQTSELIMLGGSVGSGKTALSVNILTNKYDSGETALYFSIEMPAIEIVNRVLSQLSNIDHSKIRNNNLSEADRYAIATVRASMFKDSEQCIESYKKHNSYIKFEQDLVTNYKLKTDNQIIIIDNQAMTLPDIDSKILKFKNQFGDKLNTVIVDYVNQIQIDDMYSWKQQIMLSKQLKNFARKYEVAMITPYQINDEGKARFSKGILDAADFAITMTAGNDHIKFKSTKTRGSAPFDNASYMDWKTMKIDPKIDYIEPNTEEEEKPNVKSNEELGY